MSGSPFFTNAQGEHQKTLYHSKLTQHSSLMVKFKQTPFVSQYPRPGTPGKVVYLEVDDGFEYIYQIENEKIVQILDQAEPDKWYRISAVGKGDQADIKLIPSDGASSYENDERAALQSESAAPQREKAPDPWVSASLGNPVPPPSEPTPPDYPSASSAGPIPPPPPPPSGNGITPTHVDCTAMTLETVNAFERAGTVLESDAIARIYNTHFIALSKQKGGLIR